TGFGQPRGEVRADDRSECTVKIEVVPLEHRTERGRHDSPSLLGAGYMLGCAGGRFRYGCHRNPPKGALTFFQNAGLRPDRKRTSATSRHSMKKAGGLILCATAIATTFA